MVIVIARRFDSKQSRRELAAEIDSPKSKNNIAQKVTALQNSTQSNKTA